MRSHRNTIPELNWELRENGRDLSVSLSVILLQILNQTLANSHIQFFLRRSRRRRARLRFLQVLEAVYLHFRVQRNDFGLEVRVYFTGGGGGGGRLPYIGHTGMCRWKGYGFQAI